MIARVVVRSLAVFATRDDGVCRPLCEMNNFAELGGGESVDRKARLAGQGNVLQRSPRFDLVECNGVAQRFDRRQIDRAPIAFFRGGIGISGADDFSYPYNGFVGDAVIKENFIAHAHAAEVVSGGEVTDAGPTGFALGNEIIPGVGVRFRFHEPVVFHCVVIGSKVEKGERCRP